MERKVVWWADIRADDQIKLDERPSLRTARAEGDRANDEGERTAAIKGCRRSWAKEVFSNRSFPANLICPNQS